jgi:hypothetical protein
MCEYWQQGNSYHHGAFKRLYHPAEHLYDQPVKRIFFKKRVISCARAHFGKIVFRGVINAVPLALVGLAKCIAGIIRRRCLRQIIITVVTSCFGMWCLALDSVIRKDLAQSAWESKMTPLLQAGGHSCRYLSKIIKKINGGSQLICT